MDFVNDKYDFTGETMTYKGSNYARIVAMRDIHTIDGNTVHKGDKGGWILHSRKDENGKLVMSIHDGMHLSFDTDSWVGGNAICGGEMRGNSLLKDNAVLDEGCFMNDNAMASGHAHVLNESSLDGNCHVSDYARIDFCVIGGSAIVEGNAYVHSNSYDCPLTIVHGDAHIGGLAEVSGWSDRYEVFNSPFTGTLFSGKMDIFTENYLESDIKVKNVEKEISLTSYEKQELFMAEEAVWDALEKINMPLKRKKEDEFLMNIPHSAFEKELRFDRSVASKEELKRFVNAVKSYGILKEDENVITIADLKNEMKENTILQSVKR